MGAIAHHALQEFKNKKEVSIMAKQAGEKGEQKANLYLLAIVAIVAVVGIVVLILNSGVGSISVSDDLSGQVVQTSRSVAIACRNCPDNCMYSSSTGTYSCWSVGDLVNLAATSSATLGEVTCSGCPDNQPLYGEGGKVVACISCLNPK